MPIIMMSKPDFENGVDNAVRRAVIMETYQHALAVGDRHVYFIDGETPFGTVERDACTVDGAHPNDLGFMRMADGLYPVLKTALAEK